MSGALALGVVGLGRMGGGLARQGLEKGLRVAGASRSGPPDDLLEAGLVDVGDPAGFRDALAAPRIVFISVPAGAAVDKMVDALAEALDPGDVIADGANSYWGDSVRRHQRLAGTGIGFVDLGVSGGVDGAREGACFMAGGEDAPVAALMPVLEALSVPGGAAHVGPPGGGHFAKLVHNGIEFGMMQAIGEGVDLLSRFEGGLDVGAALEVWRHGSVIRSWLIDLLAEAWAREGGLDAVPSHVEDTGEVSWLLADALMMERPTPAITAAAQALFASRDGDATRMKAVAAMRRRFGGHPYGPDADVAMERHTSRVGPFGRAPENG